LDALKLDVRRSDDLAPFRIFSRDERCELGRRTGKHGFTPVSNGLLILASARPALIVALSVSTIAAGASFGATTPNQPIAS
jgi:hypothetical protein